ncbi:MAG: branched-chain amino acid aminotransferase [Flavobacteriaceae bacterium]|jgi:branched-chain amino acid aminotransferase|nr:branched-chain amino acid aminotransferase [Flavobacteriaceae bacterium]MDG1911693.1 branched-chain amino acid aminotransferase [Flavobacteriaceae bacterium]
MKISRVKDTKINSIDFENLVFGKTFTDHMFYCHYRDGKWQTPEIKPYQPLTLDPSASVLHYGQAVFEGMKAFKDTDGKLWLFRPQDNFNRINLSAKRLQIPEFPESYFFEGMKSLLKLDQDWVQSGTGNSLYVRPFVFASQPSVQASASMEYIFMIICAPVKSYYTGGEINVLIAEEYSRAANGGVGFAKAAGNYAAQFYPTSEALKKGFQQIIWTDASNHEYLEEAGTMNIFFKIKGTLVTSPTNDRILDGITRKSIISLAKQDGIPVEERPIKVSEIKEAHENGTLEEIFGTGTAVVVLPIHSFSHQNESYRLPKETPIALQLKEKLVGIQYNTGEDPFNWRQAVD